MKTLLEAIRCAKVGGDIGIEIECEGNNLRPTDEVVEVINWHTENDGSLRGNYPNEKCEFVINKPIPFDAVENTIKALIDYEKDSEFKFSYRTSVHIHLNCQQLTEDQVYNVIYTYNLLEQPLMNYCGPTRNGNRFCLRVKDSSAIVDLQYQFIQQGFPFIKTINPDACRYAALNLAAIKKYGSIEFRGMRGTLDIKVLTNWIGAIEKIKAYALSRKNIIEIQNEFNNLGAVGFLNQVLGSLADVYSFKNMEEEITESYWDSIDLIYSYKKYTAKRREEENKAEKEPELGIEKIKRVKAQLDANWRPAQVDINQFQELFAGMAAPPREIKIRAPVKRKVIQPVVVVDDAVDAAPEIPLEW